MYDDADEFRPPPPPAARRDVTLAKEEILQEVWRIKSELKAKIDEDLEATRNILRIEIRSDFMPRFVPAFLAVLVGGYIIKYWL